jgi:hypothetical protein
MTEKQSCVAAATRTLLSFGLWKRLLGRTKSSGCSGKWLWEPISSCLVYHPYVFAFASRKVLDCWSKQDTNPETESRTIVLLCFPWVAGSTLQSLYLSCRHSTHTCEVVVQLENTGTWNRIHLARISSWTVSQFVGKSSLSTLFHTGCVCFASSVAGFSNLAQFEIVPLLGSIWAYHRLEDTKA